jgi:hypothetical protein
MKKSCSKCKLTKLLTEFAERTYKSGKTGYQSRCKSCAREYSKVRYASTPSIKEKAKEDYRTKVQLHQQFVLDYLTNHPCVDCGETDPIVLEFDHIQAETKKKDVSRMISHHSLQDVIDEISKCQVRCANCHKRRHAKQNQTTRYKLFIAN